MVIDLREQKRIIKIELETTGTNDVSLDDYIDDIVKDLEIIVSQRKQPNKLKIEIILE